MWDWEKGKGHLERFGTVWEAHLKEIIMQEVAILKPIIMNKDIHRFLEKVGRLQYWRNGDAISMEMITKALRGQTGGVRALCERRATAD